MKIPLPNLDDRRWADLVEEGRSLIPLYAPDWTDHNIHDPGITLIEMFAWIAEMDIYQLNRITDEHKRKFLSLIGITPDPPRPARTVISFRLKEGISSCRLRASTEVAGNDPFGAETRFRTLDSITILPGRLQSIQVKDGRGFQNYTDRFERFEPFGAFGDGPQAGAELYLGFTHALRRGKPFSLYFEFAGSQSGDDERARLSEEFKRQQSCRAAAAGVDCKPKASAPTKTRQSEPVPPFHGARLVWEFLSEVDGKQKWLALNANQQKVVDDTRSLTLDGRVIVRVTASMLKAAVGKVESALYWLRCRFETGAYDAAPLIERISMNGVRAEQSTATPMELTLKRDAVVEGNLPQPGGLTGFSLELDELNRVTRIKFEDNEDAPQFRVLSFKPPTPAALGSLTIEAAFVGKGNGQPLQQFKLPLAPVEQASLSLFTLEAGNWAEWTRKDDFDAATRNSFSFRLDPAAGEIDFGDGNQGRAVPTGGLIFAAYRSTRAESGNLAARTINQIVDSPHNRARLNHFDDVKGQLAEIINPAAASGGRAAETLDHAEGRAIDLMNSTTRAVTLKDYEELAMKTPGVRLARVAARAGLHPSFPCLKAPGMILLIILPSLPAARPMPGNGLKQTVARYINRRRVIGTRVEVAGPTYLEVAVRARVKALAGASKGGIKDRIVIALNQFLDPLKGGPDGTGWPFGRDVYRSEVMQVIDEVAGVDHVFSLDLMAEGCEPQCGNICLGPTWLVAAGLHEIEVV